MVESLQPIVTQANKNIEVRKCKTMPTQTYMRTFYHMYMLIYLHDWLNLVSVTSSDVGDGPACLFSDTFLWWGQQWMQALQRIEVDDDLGLEIITSDDVSHSAQGRSLNRGGSMHEQLHQPTANTRLNHCLDLVVRSIRQVRQCPTSVSEHIVICGVDQLWQSAKCRSHKVEVWLRFSTAEVAQGPSCVSQHAQFGVSSQLLEKWHDSIALKHQITAHWGITSNVS